MNALRLSCALLLLAGGLALAPARADNSAEAVAPGESTALQLAAAYQSGYLSVVSTACFQLYSSMGIIATDLSAGHIGGATALGALEQNALLLSVCQGSLEEIQGLTNAGDTQGTELLRRIGAVLAALGSLHTALVDAASLRPADRAAVQAAEQAVDSARAEVEAALAAYAAPL